MAFCNYKTDDKFSPIRRYVAVKRIRTLLIFVLFVAVCLLFGYLWGNSSKYATPATGMIFFGVISLAGIKPLGVYKLFADRYIEGEVVELKEKAVDETKAAHTQMVNFGKQITLIEMYILESDGNVQMHTMKFDGVPPDFYKPGDRVRHYSGLVLFEKEDKSGDDKIICSVCGNYLSSDEDECPFCHYPLLK